MSKGKIDQFMKKTQFCDKIVQVTLLSDHILFVQGGQKLLEYKFCNIILIYNIELNEYIALIHDALKPFECNF